MTIAMIIVIKEVVSLPLSVSFLSPLSPSLSLSLSVFHNKFETQYILHDQVYKIGLWNQE